MDRRMRTWMGLLIAMSLSSSTGCFWSATTLGPSLGILNFPIPVSPLQQKKREDAYWLQERYDRVPILGPITSGSEVVALDP